MSIGRIGAAGTNTYMPEYKSRETKEAATSDFTNTILEKSSDRSIEKYSMEGINMGIAAKNTALEAYYVSTFQSCHKLSTYDIKSTETNRYTIEEKEGGYLRIYDKERKEGFNWKLDENQIQVDKETGKKFLINDWGSGFFNMVAVDEELENGIKEALGVEELPVKELTGFTVHNDENTGICYVTADGYESRGGCIVLDEQANQKLNSLAQEYLDKYPNLVKSLNEAWFYATFEVRGLAKRTPDGIMMVSPNSVSFKSADGENDWIGYFAEEEWDNIMERFDSNNSSEISKWNYWRKFLKV